MDRKEKRIRLVNEVVQEYDKFGPFLSEEDFEAHKHLIDKFNLEYDPQKFNVRKKKSVRSVICSALWLIFGIAILLAVLAVVLPIFLSVVVIQKTPKLDDLPQCVYFRKAE